MRVMVLIKATERSEAGEMPSQDLLEQMTAFNEELVKAGVMLAGYWVWQVKSMDEATEWVKRIPNPEGEHGVVEIRPVFEADDFGDELTPELREREARLRAQTEGEA